MMQIDMLAVAAVTLSLSSSADDNKFIYTHEEWEINKEAERGRDGEKEKEWRTV